MRMPVSIRTMTNAVQTLQARGLLDSVTSDSIHTLVASPTVVYAGFDPSSSSLQAGNLVAVIGLCHFQRAGHSVIALAGGATGMIGDPSFTDSERKLLSLDTIEANLEGIRENLSRFLDFEDTTAPARIVNNADWMKGYGYIEFLREVGKFFRMGSMIGKEHVRARLHSEGGMSYAEFSYQILQAYDFLHLYDNEDCMLQIGGSDQWGNITAGIDLVHKQRGAEVFGLTMPLVCDSAGKKFGKSEGNAIYLDSRKTSFYDFYQFFLRTDDADAGRYLKIFTFLPLDEIEGIERESHKSPEQRLAQSRLAEEVTRMVHGEAGLRTAQRASHVLFGGDLQDVSADELMTIFTDVPSTDLPRPDVCNALAADVAVQAGLCKSKGEARRLIENGGFYINNLRVAGVDTTVGPSDLIDDKVLLLRSGKRTYHLVRVA